MKICTTQHWSSFYFVILVAIHTAVLHLIPKEGDCSTEVRLPPYGFTTQVKSKHGRPITKRNQSGEKNVMWIRQTVIFLLSFRFRNHFFPLTLFHRLKNKCFQSLEDLSGLANNERFVFYGFYWKNHLANFLTSENLNFLPFPTCHLWQSVISHV